MSLRARFLTMFAGLALALALAAVVSPFASSAPDPLQKMLETSANGGGSIASSWAIFGGTRAAAYSTPLAGLVGTILVFLGALGLAKLIRVGKKK